LGHRDEELDRIQETLDLPDQFILYPAQTWPHKNHVGLIRALHLIRSREGVDIPLVLTGLRNSGAAAIDVEIERLGMAELVRWMGFLEPVALASVYGRARAVVIPSRFEAASGPLWEAFAAGVAAACSNVTSLPDQAGDAALTFDPDSTNDIAAAVLQLWTNESLRETLVRRGKSRVDRFSWDRTARHFRAHYRRVGRVRMSDEDRDLLDGEPLL
jgi:glycosyltransferase involved in cell wall biosynthesis